MVGSNCTRNHTKYCYEVAFWAYQLDTIQAGFFCLSWRNDQLGRNQPTNQPTNQPSSGARHETDFILFCPKNSEPLPACGLTSYENSYACNYGLLWVILPRQHNKTNE